MLAASVLRICFIPLFLMCNVDSNHSIMPLVFHNDAIPIVLVALLGFTNGYFGALAMTSAPA